MGSRKHTEDEEYDWEDTEYEQEEIITGYWTVSTPLGHVTVLIEPDEVGFVGTVPDYPDCLAQGETVHTVLDQLREQIIRIDAGEELG